MQNGPRLPKLAAPGCQATTGPRPQDYPRRALSPLPASLVRSLLLKELALGPVLGRAAQALLKPNSWNQQLGLRSTACSKMRRLPSQTELRVKACCFPEACGF